MNTKKTDPKAIYYNQTAHATLVGNVSREANRLSKLLSIWDKLEVGPLDKGDLAHLILNDSAYFRELYKKRVWEMIDSLKVPTQTKQKLMEESQSGFIVELTQLLENATNYSFRANLVPVVGGMRSFSFEPSYFEVLDGKIYPVKDLEERTKPLFQVLADTPEKEQAVSLMYQVAEKMTELSELLEKSGLYRVEGNPIIEKSELFVLDGEGYRAMVEALL